MTQLLTEILLLMSATTIVGVVLYIALVTLAHRGEVAELRGRMGHDC